MWRMKCTRQLTEGTSGYLSKWIPNGRVAMDVVGPLPKTNCGNRYILVVNDYFTK